MSTIKQIPELSDECISAFKKLSARNIQNCQDFDALAKSVGYTDESFVNFLKDTSYSEKTLENYKKYMQSASTASSKFAATLKSVAANMAIMLAINLAIKGAAWIWDKVNVTVAETKEKYDELASSLQTMQSEYDTLSAKNPDELTSAEIQRLEYLNKRIELEQRLLDIQQHKIYSEELDTGFTASFDKDTQKYKLNDNSYISDIKVSEAAIASYNRASDAVEQYADNENKLVDAQLQREEEETKLAKVQDDLFIRMSDAQKEYDNLQAMIDSGLLTTSETKIAQESLEEWKNRLNEIKEAYNEIDNILNTPLNNLSSLDDKLTNISAEDLKKNFNSDEIAKLNSGEIKFDKNASIDNLKELLGDLQDCADENPIEAKTEVSDPWDYSETLSQLDAMSEKFDTLDKTYSKLFNSDEKIGLEDLTSINEAFSDISGIEDYVKRLQEAGQNTEEVQAVMNDLTTAYIEQTGILNNVTNENASLIQSMLQEMGVANAEELVTNALSSSMDNLALEKQYVALTSNDLVNATAEDINALYNEGVISDQTKEQLALLALQKQLANNTVIKTDADIQNLLSLANAAGIAQSAIANAKNRIANAGAGRLYSNNPDKAKKVIQGLVDDYTYTPISYNPVQATYNGGSGTAAAKKNGGGSGGSGGSGSSASEDTYEKQMDFFEERIKKLDNAVSLLKTNLDNVYGSAAKIKLINAEYDLLKEKTKNTTDALAMYEAKAAEALGKIPADLRDRVVNGAVNITDFIGKGNEDTVEAIEDYQNWADKVDDVKASLAELKKTMRELELEKFNAIVEEFTEKFDVRDSGIDNISKQIALLEEAGAVIGVSLYEEQKEQAKKQLQDLQKEKEALVKQLNESISSGRLEVGSDEWLDAAKQLQELDGNILDCKKSIEEFDNAIQELHWKNLERIEDRFSAISSELENLLGLMDDLDVAFEDGTWTEDGITQLGLIAQQYEKAAYEVEMYQKEIDSLNEAYLRGDYSTDEYIEKLGDLKDAQWDSVNDMEDAKDAIIDIYKERIDIMTEAIEKEIEERQKATDAKIEELEAEKELNDYREQLLQKQKSVVDLERQIAAMSGDTTAATVAKRKKLEQQLSEARADLDTFNKEHSIETQKEALEQSQEDFEEQKNAEIEALEETLKDEGLLIEEAFETAKINSETIAAKIEEIARKYGIKISADVTDPWKNGEGAIASYGEVLTVQSSGFIAVLQGVEDEIYKMQGKADEANRTISDIFGDKSDQLVNDLNEAYTSAENLRNVAQSLKDSFVQAFDGSGYNFDSLINKINDVTNAANAAKSAAGSVGGDSGTVEQKQVKGYHLVIKYEGGKETEIKSKTFKSIQEANDYYFKNESNFAQFLTGNKKTGHSVRPVYYAKGIKKTQSGGYAWTQDPNGTSKTNELVVNKDGSVLTYLKPGTTVFNNKSTETLYDFANDPSEFFKKYVSTDKFYYNTPTFSNFPKTNSNCVTLEIGNMVNVEGNVSDQNLALVQKAAQDAVNKSWAEINRQMRHNGAF